MRRVLLLLLASAVLSGCGGYYVLTVPDQLAPAGEHAVTVARLQRNDFFAMTMPIPNAAIQMLVPGCQERAAYTDKTGCGGTTVPVPDQPGQYQMRVWRLDSEGEQVTIDAPLYVWDPNRAVVAVDIDALPDHLSTRAEQPAMAMNLLAEDANIIYLTRRTVDQHAAIHKELAAAGYPDGPVLLWRRQRWHIVRSERFKIPKVVVEARLVNQLSDIIEQFPHLRVGICGSSIAASAFAEAGLKAVVVGSESVKGENIERRNSWPDLAERGI